MERLVPPPLLKRLRPAHWHAVDRAVAVAYGLAAWPLLGKHAGSALEFAAALVGAVCLAVPIAERRRYPVAALLLTLATCGILAIVQLRSVVAGLAALAYVLYPVATSTRLRTSVLALAAALAAACATALPDFKHTGGAVAFAFAYLVVWNVGNAVSLQRRYTGKLLTGQVSEERLRIARELHDVLAHQMSVITVQAGYGGLLLEGGGGGLAHERARSALGVIEATGRETLDEMRRLVGVLRSDGAASPSTDYAPAPGLADVDRLVEQAAHAGIRIEVSVSGTDRPLSAGEDLAAFRITQEAVTNAIKHSGGGSARVHLDYGEDELVIEICDDGDGRAAPALPATPGSGRGLAGMRERAQLYGGRLEAGRTPAGGFKVTAVLPLARPGRPPQGGSR